jgi:hypothetical protein
MKIIQGFIGLVVLLGTTFVHAYEQPKYKIVAEHSDYEIREYEPYLVAETVVDSSFDGSGGPAFRRLASYIFGENSSPTDESVRMQMTVPVARQRISDERDDRYAYWFVMENKYDKESLPTPIDERVRIREVPRRQVAALRYSGRINEANFLKHASRLTNLLDTGEYISLGEPQAAVYNGPFTLPFMRRNEVLVEIVPKEMLDADNLEKIGLDLTVK